MTMAQRTASTGLSKIAKNPSPVVLTSRPWCSAMLGSIRSRLDSLHTRMRALFIELHEAAVTGDVASDDRSQTSWTCPALWHTRPRGVDIANLIAHTPLYALEPDMFCPSRTK